MSPKNNLFPMKINEPDENEAKIFEQELDNNDKNKEVLKPKMKLGSRNNPYKKKDGTVTRCTSIHFKIEISDQLDDYHKETGIPISHVVNKAVETYLKTAPKY